jgi:uncharacterized membrane protein YhaH (DUF805 family)
MSINLNKKEEKVLWYFSKEGNQVGPFELSDLLKQINGNTMVWRDGIEWTTARLVPELSSFFPAEKPQVSSSTFDSSFQNSSQYQTSAEPKKMFAAPFSFDGRIRRTEYGISLIIYVVAYYFILSISKDVPIFGLSFIPMIWFLWAQGAKRCHDRNASGWFQLIPFYALWMLFAEGDALTNSYGPNPK